jgi:quaternary ammonium compound-resistance protein SugE
MNWIILIIAGFCETVGAVLLGIFVFHEPATFWRIFFLTTLILSIVGLKYVG